MQCFKYDSFHLFILPSISMSFYISSIVPKSGLIPFNPQREPYKSYSTRLKHFLTDAGVKRATEYHNNGQIPKMFKWLVLGETGYLDPAEIEEDDDDDEEEEVSEENTATATMDTIRNRKTVASDQEDDHEIKKKHKKQKDSHKDHKHKDKKKQHKMPPPSKRGRKPKTQLSSASTSEPSDNNTNDSLSIDPILSPQTINPLERMKIEALISSNSNDLVI